MDPSRKAPSATEALRALSASDQALSLLVVAFCEDGRLQRRLPQEVKDRLEAIWQAHIEVKQKILQLIKLMPKELEENFDRGMAAGLFAADRLDLLEFHPEAQKAFVLIEAEQLINDPDSSARP